MGVKGDVRQVHNVRFADGIVRMTSSSSDAERMLAEFDKKYKKISPQLDLEKTMSMNNGFDIAFDAFDALKPRERIPMLWLGASKSGNELSGFGAR
ncbi:hypothetical protein RB195_015353 [Necator americanus]|uniref:Reverse transcriptase domain-containing protein n=1 Tax=Necator americanus TaxID=51031 RepID=A0ABR1E463_NECAM